MSSTKKARIVPLQQGHLDGLCGVYSIINATRCVIGALSDEEGKNLFLKIVKYLQERKNGLDFFVDGITIKDIGGTLRDVVEPTFPIKREKPLEKKPGLPLDEFWDHMRDFLAVPNHAIILGLTGKYDHWTVVKSITKNRLSLMDSDRLFWLNKSSVTTGEPNKNYTHGLPPTMAYYLSLKDDSD